MSTPVLESSYNIDQSSVSSLVFNKPSGLAVGDLMFVYIFATNATLTVTTPDGWISVASIDGGNNTKSKLYKKKAISTDVAASTFTFSLDGTYVAGGSILRISGTNINGDLVSTTTMATGLTPYNSNNLMIMFVHLDGTSGGAGSEIDGYAITNNNPSWTEVYKSVNNYNAFSVAYASRVESTTTGAYTYNTTIAIVGKYGTLISITESKDVSISETTSISESYTKSIKVYFSDILSLSESYLETIVRLWKRVSKPVTTWINKNKN